MSSGWRTVTSRRQLFTLLASVNSPTSSLLLFIPFSLKFIIYSLFSYTICIYDKLQYIKCPLPDQSLIRLDLIILLEGIQQDALLFKQRAFMGQVTWKLLDKVEVKLTQDAS